MDLRTPPNEVLAEKALLGSLLLKPSFIIDIAPFITEDVFYDKKNGIIFGVMLMLQKKNIPIDIISVSSELRAIGRLDDAGGNSYLADVAGSSPLSSSAESYAKIIHDKYVLRKLVEAGDHISELGFSNTTAVDAAVESANSKLIGLTGNTRSEETDIPSIINEFDLVQEEFKNKQFGENKLIGIPTGLAKIDNVIDGLRPGHFWSIAGYTSSGKTQCLLNIINNVMVHTQVAFFSLEMSKTDIVSRLLGIQSGVGITKIMRHEFSNQDEVDRFTAARTRLLDSKLRIYSRTSTLDGIMLAMSREMLRNKTKVFAIDYIQLVRTGSRSEYEQITEAAQRLQTFARETGCTIIVLSQVSNEHARDPNQEVHGTKGGGSLPASVDLAIELFNEDKKEERDEKIYRGEPLLVKAIIKKNRHGRCGYVKLNFTPWNGQFTEYSGIDDF